MDRSLGSDDEVRECDGNARELHVLYTHQIAAQLMGGERSPAEVQVLHFLFSF